MVSCVLLVLSIVLVILSYLILLVNWVSIGKKKQDNYTGFDIAKEITANYDEINIVSSKDIIFSEYDINRNVIRLNNKNYDGNSLWDIVISSILAGFSLVNVDNKEYFKFSFMFKKIRVLSLVSLVMLFLSLFVGNIGDARIGIVVTIVLLVYLYMRYQIISSANIFIENNLDKDIYNSIKSIVGGYINFYKISFIAGLIMVLRLVVIILRI